MNGEGAEDLDSGLGASALVGVEFAGNYAAKIRVGYGRYVDDIADSDATLIYGAVYVTRFWSVPGLEVEAGIGVGGNRLSRDFFTRTNSGWLAAGVLNLRRRLTAALAIEAGLDAHSTSYPTPALEGPAPVDPDRHAMAGQLGFSLGLSWRIPFDAGDTDSSRLPLGRPE